MKKYLRCKACGYIIEETSLKEVCPACGVPHTTFEPFTSKVAEKRRMLLSFHIHPIMVHFPQSFSLFFPVCLIIAMLLPIQCKEYFYNTAKVLAFFLPLSIPGGLISGMIDGKLRFKKISRPALVKKIIIGSCFFVFSTIIAILAISVGFENIRILSIIFILSTLDIGCAGLLGKAGASLLDAILPGE